MNLFKQILVYSNRWLEFYRWFGASGVLYVASGYEDNHPVLVFRPTTLIPLCLMLHGFNLYFAISLIFFVYGYSEVYVKMPWVHRRSTDPYELVEYGYTFDGGVSHKLAFSILAGKIRFSILPTWLEK